MKYKINFKRSTQRYRKIDLFDNIDKVWVFLKKQPCVKDMESFPSKICFTTYFNHFGSWKNAIMEFVKFKNNGVLKEENQNKEIKEKRRSFNNSLRYDIMKRDSFKCILCGASPATNSKTELEIDHIVPIAKGGSNKESNLQTLCKNCNIGKSNKL